MSSELEAEISGNGFVRSFLRADIYDMDIKHIFLSIGVRPPFVCDARAGGHISKVSYWLSWGFLTKHFTQVSFHFRRAFRIHPGNSCECENMSNISCVCLPACIRRCGWFVYKGEYISLSCCFSSSIVFSITLFNQFLLFNNYQNIPRNRHGQYLSCPRFKCAIEELSRGR